MKEAYFTPENIDEKAREWLRELARFRERHVPDFHPESSALLVIDMQRYFIDEDSHAYVPSVAAIVPRLRDLLNSFIANGLPVIFTRHIDIDGEENTMIKWWDGAIKEDDEESGLIPDLLHPDAIVIRKHQYDAFHQTQLEDVLRRRKITQVVISGVMTHLCCETTARSAFVRNFDCLFLVDGTATYNADFHRAALLNLAHGFAVPVLCSELQKKLKDWNGGEG